MKTETEALEQVPSQITLLKPFLLALPMMILTFMILSGGKPPSGPSRLLALVITFIFFNLLFVLMIRTGKTDRYRAVLFVTYAVAFVISFISHLVEARGSMELSVANMIEGQTPFCQIVIPMTLIPAALTKTIIFPGTIVGGFASISSMFVLWIGASLSLGRGFCGWACFFGGLEDGFSRLFKTSIIKRINLKWSYLPYGVLLAVVLTAAISLSPTYCTWLCPFKTVTEYVEVTSVKVFIQTIIFLSLFVGLVVVLPILTKRRTQCGLFCPFGAFQSFTNKVNAFDIRIDQDKCVKCGRCAQVCPTFSMDHGSIDKGRTRITCMKCGKCVDACPKTAISYHVKGAPLPGKTEWHRLFFLYPAFLFLATMAGGNLVDAIVRIIRLIATGSMI
jgi:ferredoxin-type protein NapH